jgi:glycolate oxidase
MEEGKVSLLVERIKEFFTEDEFSTELAERFAYAKDVSPLDVSADVLPDVVVWPRTSEQVSNLVKVASEMSVPVVPRGAGSGESGGSMPVEGGVVLDLTFMKKVLDLDEKNLTCLVEPGIVCDDLNFFLKKKGFFLPPVPASSEMATIGGCVANNSGGYRTVKYGSFKNWVMELEVVLPDGDIIRTGAKTRKSSSGYDLTRLYVGSEGTLGIFTKILLRVHPLPQCIRLVTATFDDIIKACDMTVELMSSDIIPSAVEIMDRLSIEAVRNYGVKLPRCDSFLIVELDGFEADVEQRVERVRKMALDCGADEVSVGTSEDEINALWKGRKSITPALVAIKPSIIDEDVAVPVANVPDLFKRLVKIAKDLDIEIATYGHVGDGSLHPDILFDKRNPEEVKKAFRAIEMLREATLSLDGTVTAEHGIGLRRKKYLELEYGSKEVEIMGRIKRALDPKNIMNPKKILDLGE